MRDQHFLLETCFPDIVVTVIAASGIPSMLKGHLYIRVAAQVQKLLWEEKCPVTGIKIERRLKIFPSSLGR